MYKLFKSPLTGSTTGIIRNPDGVFIPLDEANTDYQAYLKYVAEGGVVLPADEGTN